MKRIFLYLFMVLTVVSCKKEKPVPPTPEPLPGYEVSDGTFDGSAPQTTLIYFTGTSLYSYFRKNIYDAKAAISSGALGSGGSFYYFLPSSKTSAKLYELYMDGGECVERLVVTYDFLPVMLSISVTQVIEHVKSDIGYAEGDDMNFNLVVSGHGTGWVPQEYPQLKSISTESASMWDKQEGALMTRFMGSSSDGFMDIEDLRQGIVGSNTKFGFILFDECFMSNIETLYRLKECSDYIIASPCEVMSDGFPYNYVLPKMFTDDGYNFDTIGVCEAYNHYYTNIASYKYGCVAMCVTSELENLSNIVSSMNFNLVDNSELQTYENLTDNVFYDLGQLVNIACEDDAMLEEFNARFDCAFPQSARLHTNRYYTALVGAGVQDINYYSGVTTSDPSIKFREEWVVEPWVVASGRDISVE